MEGGLMGKSGAERPPLEGAQELVIERRNYEYAIGHYLNECYRKRALATTKELALRIERNRSTYSRKATKILGKSLLAAMRESQLEEATKLLATTHLSLAEIAARSGFGEVESTFFRCFRRAFGITPNEYRKVHEKRTMRRQNRSKTRKKRGNKLQVFTR
jgi:AraC-like DNA-binding protein